MTVIVGLKARGRVWMGGDSASTNTTYRLTHRSDAKVFPSGPYVIGFSTSYRMGQIIRHTTLPVPEGSDAAESIHAFMVVTFVEHVRRICKELGWSRVKDNVEEGGVFLVAWRDQLFRVESDWQVIEAGDDYLACGCAEDVALGSLYGTAELGHDPFERVLRALKAADHHSVAVQSPFTIHNTEGSPCDA